jgi:dTDP-4-amino-4,6-dideoxygalactose transaminase
MQQGKPLTSGEGGAVITDDEELYGRLQRLRADGRLYAETTPGVGSMELVEVGHLMGNNRCLSEFQAAILIEQLGLLDEQNRRRAENALYLDGLLAEAGPFTPQSTSPGTTARTYYQYLVSFDEEEFEGVPGQLLAEALTAELGFRVGRTYAPLNHNILYDPATRRRFRFSEEYLRRVAPEQFSLPECERAHRRSVIFHHSVLLGSRRDMEDIAAAFRKVYEQREALRRRAVPE